METKSTPVRSAWRVLRWPAVAAVAPIVFGSNYWVTHEFLPADAPLWGSALRALPAGFVLLLIVRRLPRGRWWLTAAALGTLNMGLFFCLVYVSAQLLPSSVAASVTSVAPLMIAGFAWLLLRERPRPRVVVGAAGGAIGVVLIVGTADGGLDTLGVAASVAAMLLSCLGAVLTRTWGAGAPVLPLTAWQLLIGGLELTVVALLFEGMPPALDAGEIGAVAYSSLVATALGYWCWFTGFRHLPAALVGVIGLLNPVTGVALGVLLGGERLAGAQIAGILLVLTAIVFAHLGGGRAPTPPVAARSQERETSAR